MHGGEGIYRLELGAEISREEIQPEFKLKTSVQASQRTTSTVPIPADGGGVPYLYCNIFKGTGTRDLIWLKVVSLDRSWLVGLTDDH